MKVKMKVGVSGTRNGQDWPQPGSILECDPEEGAQLCASGIAVPVVEEKTEKAVAPEPERRGPGRPRKVEEEVSDSAATAAAHRKGH